MTSDFHIPALRWQEGSSLRARWVDLLTRGVFNARLGCQVDDIVVMGLFSQMGRKARHRPARMSKEPQINPDDIPYFRAIFERRKSQLFAGEDYHDLRDQTVELFQELWAWGARGLNLQNSPNASDAFLW